MRVAVVHSFYSDAQPSGENVVVEAQIEALTRAGHDVRLISRRTSISEPSNVDKLRLAWSVASGFGGTPLADLQDFDPEVVHVHNLFPNFGTHWLDAWPGPLVATLHNFRAVCAAATLTRDGNECTLCPDGAPLSAIRHRCYRGSKSATLPIALSSLMRTGTGRLASRADRVVVLSERARSTFSRWIEGADDWTVLPNFVPGNAPAGPIQRPDPPRFAFVGRLAPEKGFERLVELWPRSHQLDVYGDGPLRDLVADQAASNISFKGLVQHDELMSRLGSYTALLFPSQWAEGAPMIAAEALFLGVPVIATEGNTVGDDIRESGAGVTMPRRFTAADLARALVTVVDRPELRSVARQQFVRNYSEKRWVDGIVDEYRHAIGAKR
jgi:glycosyltransferase involved in cell wall biosynthesis